MGHTNLSTIAVTTARVWASVARAMGTDFGPLILKAPGVGQRTFTT